MLSQIPAKLVSVTRCLWLKSTESEPFPSSLLATRLLFLPCLWLLTPSSHAERAAVLLLGLGKGRLQTTEELNPAHLFTWAGSSVLGTVLLSS